MPICKFLIFEDEDEDDDEDDLGKFLIRTAMSLETLNPEPRTLNLLQKLTRDTRHLKPIFNPPFILPNPYESDYIFDIITTINWGTGLEIQY